jgi:hypothetical protein
MNSFLCQAEINDAPHGALLSTSPTPTATTTHTVTFRMTMGDLSLDQKCKLAAELIVQSPPGEVK